MHIYFLSSLKFWASYIQWKTVCSSFPSFSCSRDITPFSELVMRKKRLQRPFFGSNLSFSCVRCTKSAEILETLWNTTLLQMESSFSCSGDIMSFSKLIMLKKRPQPLFFGLNLSFSCVAFVQKKTDMLEPL